MAKKRTSWDSAQQVEFQRDPGHTAPWEPGTYLMPDLDCKGWHWVKDHKFSSRLYLPTRRIR